MSTVTASLLVQYPCPDLYSGIRSFSRWVSLPTSSLVIICVADPIDNFSSLKDLEHAEHAIEQNTAHRFMSGLPYSLSPRELRDYRAFQYSVL